MKKERYWKDTPYEQWEEVLYLKYNTTTEDINKLLNLIELYIYENTKIL